METNEKIIITLDTENPAYAEVQTIQRLARSTKTISVESLTDVLGKHATRTSPMLPNQLLRYKERSKDNIYMTQVPAHRRTVKYIISGTTTEYDIMVPNIVLLTRFERVPGSNNVRFLNSFMIATKYPVMTGLEDAYYAPFGNIYGRGDTDSRNHEICWGSDATLGTSLKMIDMHPDIFFRAAFNTDLDSNRFLDHTIEDFNIFKTNHLYQKMNSLFQSGKTEEEVLEYLHTYMKPIPSMNVNQQFEIY